MGNRGVEKMPLPAKAMKVPMSLMMSARPAVRMGAKLLVLAMLPLASSVRVLVVGLGGEGHIAEATLGACWRAWLKMTTGEELESRERGAALLESDSVCVPFGQLSGACLRWCRPC